MCVMYEAGSHVCYVRGWVPCVLCTRLGPMCVMYEAGSHVCYVRGWVPCVLCTRLGPMCVMYEAGSHVCYVRGWVPCVLCTRLGPMCVMLITEHKQKHVRSHGFSTPPHPTQVFLNQSAISARIDGLMASGRSLDFSSCQTFQRTVCTLAATFPCITYASVSCMTLLLMVLLTLSALLILQPSNDSFVLNYYCAVTNTGNERNPIIAILAQDPVNGYYCFCQILSSTVSSGVSCSLFVTVCPVVNGTLSVV